ncbi:MAG: metallophosphoesterase family protein [Solirubrobacterales bacterium]
MRAAVISDIHANLPALEAVLASIEESGTEETWCLGDVVGYGADPDACARLVEESCQVKLVGNHDLAVLGELDISSFSAAAAEAVRWTQEVAAPETLEMLRAGRPAGEREGMGLFHASPRDPVWEYVLSIEQAEDCMEAAERPVNLIGHSHVALYFEAPPGESGGEARGSPAPEGSRLRLGEGRWLLNPGSVGQPRDGDPRAAWLELDTEAASALFHRVPYDVGKAAGSILDAGLPRHLADRLHLGQ